MTGHRRPLIRRSIHIVDYRPRALVNPAALAFELPYDVTVEDPRLGYSYFNDPWWPEVGALLRDRYDWPRTDLSPLGKLALADDKAARQEAAAALSVREPGSGRGLRGSPGRPERSSCSSSTMGRVRPAGRSPRP